MWESFVEVFANGLQLLYNLTGNLGWAIIIFTVITRLLLLPLTLKSLRSQKKLQALQPRMRELQRKYGKDREKMAQETMKLYKEEGVNPAGGCLPILIQLPIFFAVYGAVIKLVDNKEIVNSFLWIDNLGAADPLFILPVLSIVLQFVVQLMATPRVQDPQQRAMTRAMLFMPLFFGYFAFTFPSGAVLYWVMGTVIAIIQQYFTTGWGLLANYLPFLPADKGYMNKNQPVSQTEELVAEGASGQSAAVVAPSTSFWDVLGKLTTENGEVAESQEEQEERAIAAVRSQGQRPRRRRRS